MDHLCHFRLVFVMPSCASVFLCLVVTCWERADFLALVCDVLSRSCHFPIGILGQVSIPDLALFLTFTRTIRAIIGLWH